MEGHGNGRDGGRRKGRWELGEGGEGKEKKEKAMGVDPTKFWRNSTPLLLSVEINT